MLFSLLNGGEDARISDQRESARDPDREGNFATPAGEREGAKEGKRGVDRERERCRRTREGVDIVTDTGKERLLVQERERAQELRERERARVHMAFGIFAPGCLDTGTGVGGHRERGL